MTRSFAAFLATVAALALASRADAHGYGLAIVGLCGASGCRTIDAGLELAHHHERGDRDLGPRFADTPPLGPYYELVVSNEAARAWYVPYPGVVRARVGYEAPHLTAWIEINARPERSLRALLRGVEPFPPPRLTYVAIAGREASDPDSYLGLFDPSLARAPSASTYRMLRISVRFSRPNPWADVSRRLFYVPDRKLLARDTDFLRLSDELVMALEHPEDDRFPWRVLSLTGVTALLAVLLLIGWSRIRARSAFSRRSADR